MEENTEFENDVTENQETETATDAVDVPVDDGTDDGANDEPAEHIALLDSITEGTDSPSDTETDDDAPVDDAQPQDDGNQQQTAPEQQDAELSELTADVKSERSKERIADLLHGHRKLKEEADAIKHQNDTFSQIIRNTGMNATEFANTVEFCRLARSDSHDDLKVALNILEKERQAIYDRLGMIAPGSDPLAGRDDLKQKVDNLEMSQEDAIKMANYERLMQQHQEQMRQQAHERQRTLQYQNQVAAFQSQAVNLFNQLKQTDPNYSGKEQALLQYLSAHSRQMIDNFTPEQWTLHLKAVYDAIPAQPVQKPRVVTPLSQRPQALSRPSIKGTSAHDVAKSALEVLGL